MEDKDNKTTLLKRSFKVIKQLEGQVAALRQSMHEPIAIIGMGCRFPGGVNNPSKLWEVISEGRDGIIEVPPSRWDVDAFYDPNKEAPGKMYTRKGGFLQQPVDLFDAGFFNISPREANDMDPQQRLSLEVAWEALEDAGINPGALKNSLTGVFMGICFNDYGHLITQSSHLEAVDHYYSTGNHYSVLSGRIAYFFGFTGPAISLDTACSSSLVSIDEACQQLRQQRCHLALAGGVNLMLSPEPMINFCKSGMIAADGYCKTFDAKADGYSRGEGCGIIVLKRLSDALVQHDRIYAVIRGAAVNQDGASSGLTVPNGRAQKAVIEAALLEAQVNPTEIHYVEVHGTGTALGDPVEVKALSEVYGKHRSSDNALVLGSLKTNLGHTEAAAGVASVIKVVLSLQHEYIPKHCHFSELNPHIDLQSFHAKIPIEGEEWKKGEQPRLAGISSFGFSGTNAHLILSESVPQEFMETTSKTPGLFTLSAKNEKALLNYIDLIANTISLHASIDFTALCYTVQRSRSGLPCKIAVIAKDLEDLLKQLNQQFYSMEANSLEFRKRVTLKKTVGDDLREIEKENELTIEYTDQVDWQSVLEKLQAYYLQGYDIEWLSCYDDHFPNIISLPHYPFQRDSYWLSTISIAPQREVKIPPEEVIKRPALWEELIKVEKAEYLNTIESYVQQVLFEILDLKTAPENAKTINFHSLGMDSIMAIKFKNQLEEALHHYLSFPSSLAFDYPTILEVSEYMDEKILELMKQEKYETQLLPIEQISKTGRTHYELSPAQKRMWFMYELNREDTAYNISIYGRLQGEIKVELLQQALDKVVERHAILRTTYEYLDNNIMQVIQTPTSHPIDQKDWRTLLEAEQNKQFDIFQQDLRVFDLTKTPLLRATLIWLSGNDEAMLHLETHHIACDGTSFQIIIDDWMDGYEALVAKGQVDQSPVPLEYVDYANWLLEGHKTRQYEEHLHYWLEQLADAPRMIHLPTDFPRQQVEHYEGAIYTFDVEPSLKQRVEGFAQSQHTTPFAVLLSVYALVLHKYSRDDEINVGIPFASRTLGEVEDMVGLFVNTLVIRHTFIEDNTFSGVLKDSSQNIREAFLHQAASFEEVIDVLKIERNLAIHPLFQVHFNLLPGLFQRWKALDLNLKILGGNSGYPDFDLSLEMFESETDYHSAIKYNAKTFTESTISRFVNHFIGLLEQVLDEPTLQLSEMSLLGREEQKLVLDTWNQTKKEYALDKNVIDLFQAQVKDNPDKVAAMFKDAELTYGELNQQANQLCHYLTQFNLQPDELVGVCLPRSLEMLIAVLGVMKLGGSLCAFGSKFSESPLELHGREFQITLSCHT